MGIREIRANIAIVQPAKLASQEEEGVGGEINKLKKLTNRYSSKRDFNRKKNTDAASSGKPPPAKRRKAPRADPPGPRGALGWCAAPRQGPQ